MSEEEVPGSRFSGRTYGSRARQSGDNAQGRAVKAGMSVSKWGKANYAPLRESGDEATDAKRKKLDNRNEDPFSFDTGEDPKRKGVRVKKETIVANPHGLGSDMHKTTRLPASRIQTLEEEGGSNIKSGIRTYSRTTPKKPVVMDQFVEVGKATISAQGEQVFLSPGLKHDLTKAKVEEDDDDIFPVSFNRAPLKTYTGDVVTPDDKPDEPISYRKSAYKKKGGPRGRKPLTVTDPGLIEEYKRNYAAQQQKGKFDPSTGGLNNSMVVSKQELANEDQGTTLVVVCKPKGEVEKKTDVQNKYFAKNVKGTRGMIVPVGQLQPSQDNSSQEESGSLSEVSPNPDSAPTRASSRLRNSVQTSSEESQSTPGNGSVQYSQSSPLKKEIVQGKTPDISSSQQSTASESGSSQASGKRYRIFKSRAPQMDEELKPPLFKDDLDENPIPAASEVLVLDIDQSSESMNTEEAIDNQPPFLTPEDSSQYSVPENTDNLDVKVEEDPVIAKPKVPIAARASLAARLKVMEKGNESDSTDNMSECSDNFTSQESPANSQTIDNSHKEVEAAGPVRKFFKSKKSSSSGSDLQRKLYSSSPAKSPAKVTYNARAWINDKDKDEEIEESAFRKSSSNSKQDDVVLVKDSRKSDLKREVHWPETKFDEAYTSLKVDKKVKSLYTVIQNVKQTHEVQELGETQDFIDDVDYLLDSLQDSKSNSIRCLSCLKLAGKCIQPAFRMHLRAHGTVTKIFSLLHDACTDPSLALSTSSIMFMLSRDRLNLDLDQDSLSLMLRLNEVDAVTTDLDKLSIRDLEKYKVRVQELLTQLQKETNAKEIDLGFVSTSNLAMESLLSLTSRKAGEWFKEELRTVGGLDHIVDSVVASEKSLPESMAEEMTTVLPLLRKLDRCLRVLENMSIHNDDNQNYLIAYKQATLLSSCTRTLRLCQRHMSQFKVTETLDDNVDTKDQPGYQMLNCLLAVLRVLLNITHERPLGKFTESEETDLISAIVVCLTATQWCIPVEQRFDLSILCLGLLINLLENKKDNRQRLMDMTTTVQVSERQGPRQMDVVNAVVQMFVERENAAREMEEDSEGNTSTAESPNKSNTSGEWKESDSGIEWITNNIKKAKEEAEKDSSKAEDMNQSILEDDEETFTKALHKAGRHMENSIVASYAALLLGTLITDNQDYAQSLKQLIPNNDFQPMIKILKKFLNFMSLTTAFSSTDVNGITKVINVLEAA